MAIAFDNTSTVQTATTTTSKTYSFTVGTGTNRMLFVAIGANVSIATLPTSVTYAGSAMTLVKSMGFNSGSKSVLIYSVIAPASGANNVVVTYASATTFYSATVSYSGINQSTTADNSAATSGTSTSTAPTLTTVANNCWTFGFTYASGSVTAGSGTTLRTGTGQFAGFVDSNGAITPAGSTTLNMSFASGAFGAAMVSFAPATIGALPSSALFFAL